MSDTPSAVNVPSPHASLFNLDDSAEQLWTEADFGAILRHQLGTPIQVELGSLTAPAAAKVRLACDSHQLLLKSISDVIAHPNPPAELLELLKDFAKTMLEHPDSAIPRPVAAVLYWLAIATGLVRLHKRLTSLSDENLSEGIEWAMARSWVQPEFKVILKQANQLLESGEDSP